MHKINSILQLKKFKVMNTQNNSLTRTSDAPVNSMSTASTVATSQPKAFTVADLWNIQRQKKSLLQRRHA
jgi:hypothetical protein